MSNPTYGELLSLADEAFAMGYVSISWWGRTYPIKYSKAGFSVKMSTVNGVLEVYSEPISRSMTGRLVRLGARILRVKVNDYLLSFGTIDGRFVDNIEHECARAVLQAS